MVSYRIDYRLFIGSLVDYLRVINDRDVVALRDLEAGEFAAAANMEAVNDAI